VLPKQIFNQVIYQKLITAESRQVEMYVKEVVTNYRIARTACITKI